MAYRSSLYGQSVRQAASEGLRDDAMVARANELLSNVSKRMHDEALAEAERMTFTNDSHGAIGMFADMTSKFVNTYPAFKFIVPFIRTPTALLERSINMSPFAVIQKEFRDRVARGGADADVAIGEMLFGTSMFSLFMMLYHEGVVTGSGPENYAQREAWRKLNIQPYSIKIGDRYVSYKRGFDPLSMSIGATMTMLDRMSYQQTDPTNSDWALGTMLGLAKYFSDQPYMTGLATIMAAVDGKVDGDTYLARQASGFIPSLWRDIESGRRGIQGKNETPTVYRGQEFWRMLNGYLEQRLPGNTGDDLPPLRYWDGSVVTAGGGNALYLYNSLSPIAISIPEDDKASRALAANGVKVSPPTPTITVWDGARIKVDILNDLKNGEKLYDKYLQTVGESRRKAVETVIGSREFDKLDSGPDADQAIALEKALGQGLSAGRNEFLKWLIKEKPSVEEYGPNAVLLDPRRVKTMLNRMKRDALDEQEKDMLTKAGTRGMGTRGELYVPPI